MLAAHNAVRAQAQPPPSPALRPLTWSDDAAAVAEDWAEGCLFEHNAGRGELGENLYATSASAHEALVVDTWASEVGYYDYGANRCVPGGVCGHYTQLVWRETTQVGCARRLCQAHSPFSSGGDWELWVCDYAPPGNFVGQRPY
jgi:hypothetical protein